MRTPTDTVHIQRHLPKFAKESHDSNVTLQEKIMMNEGECAKLGDRVQGGEGDLQEFREAERVAGERVRHVPV